MNSNKLNKVNKKLKLTVTITTTVTRIIKVSTRTTTTKYYANNTIIRYSLIIIT